MPRNETPGPWSVAGGRGGTSGPWIVRDASGMLVASVPLEAEAHEIAALPDFEAALEMGLRLSDDEGGDHNAFVALENEFVEKGRAALAKVKDKGRSVSGATPSPWEAMHFNTIVGANGEVVAIVNMDAQRDGDARADARRIAAAPEMEAALEALIVHLGEEYEARGRLPTASVAKAVQDGAVALAKAKGPVMSGDRVIAWADHLPNRLEGVRIPAKAWAILDDMRGRALTPALIAHYSAALAPYNLSVEADETDGSVVVLSAAQDD